MVHVWHTVPAPHHDDVTRSGPKDAWRAVTARVRALPEGAGVECEELVAFGRPERTILDVDEEAPRRANRTVIVVGGHPERGGEDGVGGR